MKFVIQNQGGPRTNLLIRFLFHLLSFSIFKSCRIIVPFIGTESDV